MIGDFLLAASVITRLILFMFKNLYRESGKPTGMVGRSVLLLLGLSGIFIVYKSISIRENDNQVHLVEVSRKFYDGVYREKDGFAIAGNCDHGHDSKCMMTRKYHPFSDEVERTFQSLSLFSDHAELNFFATAAARKPRNLFVSEHRRLGMR